MTKLEKLIAEYVGKARLEEKSIVAAETRMHEARQDNSEFFFDGAKAEKNAAQIRRQAYVQIIKDLEDLQDAN